MNKKILIAIHDISLANTIMDNLTENGYISEFVRNGDDVIDEMKKIKPDLLLIDIKLQGKSGYDVLNEKSFDREVTKIPVIVVSNSGEPVHMKKIPSTPMIRDYMIALHIDIPTLIRKVEKIFV